MELRPCTSCRRHVEIVELTCPFCATTLARTAPRTIRLGHVSRAVVFGASLSACWAGKSTAPPDPDHGGSVGSGSATEVNGRVMDDHQQVHFAQPPTDAGAVVDASPPDASPPDATPPDAAVNKVPPPDDWRRQRRNDGPCCKPYGAPPARRRLV